MGGEPNYWHPLGAHPQSKNPTNNCQVAKGQIRLHGFQLRWASTASVPLVFFVWWNQKKQPMFDGSYIRLWKNICQNKIQPKLSESATEILFVCFWCGTIFVKGELVGGWTIFPGIGVNIKHILSCHHLFIISYSTSVHSAKKKHTIHFNRV